MARAHRKLPSPNAVVVFEAAARHRNFTRAAIELGISQAAVSRHVKRLEDELQAPLFRREWRGLALTADGRQFHGAVAMGLEHIANAAARIRRRRDRRQVTIAANNAVAFSWLRRRVAAFMQAHPDVDLRMVASDRHLDFLDDGIDIAVRYGDGQWPGVEATLLFPEEVFPVCAPAYLTGRQAPRHARDLPGETLLHLDPHGPDWITWPALLRALDVEPGPGVERGPRFDTFPVLLQAALDGQGMAIGTRYLLDEPLSDGRLVRPVPGSLLTGRGYYLALPASEPRAAPVRDLHAWLCAAERCAGGA